MVQIFQQSASLNANGSITLQLPPNTYRLDKTKVQILFTCPRTAGQNEVNGRVCARADCLPASLQCQITYDGQQIMNVQNLNILQYSHYWREKSTDKDQCFASDAALAAGLDRSKKAVQVIGMRDPIANAATSQYIATFDFNHFFGGLFSGEKFLHVQNQLVITLQLNIGTADSTPIAFMIGANANANTSVATSVNSTNISRLTTNNAGNLVGAVQNVRMRVLACIPQIPPQVQKKFQNTITQYSAQSASSLNFTYVPQAGILYAIHMGFFTNIQAGAEYNGISFPDVLGQVNGIDHNDLLDGQSSRITYNGLQLIQTAANTKGDFKNQLRALAAPNPKQDSLANEAFVDVQVAGEQIQIQTALGVDACMQSFTFYESVPIMQTGGMIQ